MTGCPLTPKQIQVGRIVLNHLREHSAKQSYADERAQVRERIQEIYADVVRIPEDDPRQIFLLTQLYRLAHDGLRASAEIGAVLVSHYNARTCDNLVGMLAELHEISDFLWNRVRQRHLRSSVANRVTVFAHVTESSALLAVASALVQFQCAYHALEENPEEALQCERAEDSRLLHNIFAAPWPNWDDYEIARAELEVEEARFRTNCSLALISAGGEAHGPQIPNTPLAQTAKATTSPPAPGEPQTVYARIKATPDKKVSYRELAKAIGKSDRVIQDWRKNPRVLKAYPQLLRVSPKTACRGADVSLHKAADAFHDAGFLT